MQMRFAAAILILGTCGASAADLAIKQAEPVVPVAIYNWTGPYIGVHAGYGWGQEHDDQSRLFPAETDPGTGGGGTDKYDMDGFLGGVHAGYNYQTGQFVFGTEGDIDYSGVKGTGHGTYLGGTIPRTLKMEDRWQGSARLRAGFAIDNLLLYATGGLAFAEGKLTSSGPDIATTSSTKTHLGWTAGLGAEYAFTQNWIGRAEVRYTDFQKKRYRTSDGPVKAGWDQVTTNVGVSYKF